MTDTEAIALRANRAKERHVESGTYSGKCFECGPFILWPCDAASLAADIPELLARVREDQFDIDKLLEAGGIALMLREEAAKSGNLSLVSALEPLRHAVESVTADRAKP